MHHESVPITHGTPSLWWWMDATGLTVSQNDFPTAQQIHTVSLQLQWVLQRLKLHKTQLTAHAIENFHPLLPAQFPFPLKWPHFPLVEFFKILISNQMQVQKWGKLGKCFQMKDIFKTDVVLKSFFFLVKQSCSRQGIPSNSVLNYSLEMLLDCTILTCTISNRSARFFFLIPLYNAFATTGIFACK